MKFRGPQGWVDKITCPVSLTSSSRGWGKVGIARSLRDFQAKWESLLLDFSSSRLFHSPSRGHFGCSNGRPLGRVMAESVRSVRDTQSSVQMLMNHDVAARQRGSEAHRLDL